MRKIEYTNQFKRDYKRELKGYHRITLQHEFVEILKTLAEDRPLAPKYQYHALTGDWKDHRDLHVKPDLILIYRKLNHIIFGVLF